MLTSLRRRRAARLAGTTFCEACGSVCAAACRAQAHLDRVRTQALTRTHRASRHIAAGLRHHLETGRLSPRKRRQLRRAARTTLT